jgi:anti-sigma factor RsiW
MARVIPLDTDEHQAAQSLLPWYVNGTLGAEESERVRKHLAECPRCQADAQWQDRLRAAPPAAEPTSASDVDRQWAALAGRLAPGGTKPPRRPHALANWLGTRWLPLAVGLQTVVILAGALAWFGVPQREEAFRALGTAPAAISANVLVVFRPGASEADIRRVLRANHAQIVGGPTVTDAYLLRLAALTPEALSRLRADAAVLRVESLEGDAR